MPRMLSAAKAKPPSERQQIAQRFAVFIVENHLANPFGGDVSQSSDKKYYGVLFSRPRLLDGFVRVYSPKFILVEMTGPAARLGSSRVFESEKDATDFLRLAFVEYDMDAAAKVPTKPAKGS